MKDPARRPEPGRTRVILILTGLCLALGLAAATLALTRFSDDPLALVFERRERVVFALPDGSGRIVLTRSTLGPLIEGHRRTLVLERAGQPVIETMLFDAPEPASPVRVYWIDAEETANAGPYLRLVEAGGEVLVDPLTPAVVRVLRKPSGAVLTSPAGDARAGGVIGPDGALTLTDGLDGARLPPSPGRLIGEIVGADDGPLSFRPHP
ncbi:hypothetical protein [Rhodospirillum rubrum]|uniref:Uncharacterized protein n=1 Tax=Rhodospirillum rubrum (strain ATCC 11170 / ATH 1.1.1 / DSM 467 / LMG 4362 / NCIMB 8255 / S1) TaxID=269796 RepID=Q2RP82_RHORT|nr:hypothetical protein [Rhodospirillum rubrum]ABC24063.1 hypothetical protein Rru_A3268 [Rhodospirillum rubrum ATCC 11170]AEO49809.1 hypothetical protein F11_16745 [Rhodospirillum rubrum F11]MBK5955748.1 hypothetical protein [Rhodospirillum rubrum]QXG80006.1 hypothetical protein KUL73_16850 [Rhodospirillum rubrum]HAP99335.1 hypothetical protein [Rhodospirillum rubrum]